VSFQSVTIGNLLDIRVWSFSFVAFREEEEEEEEEEGVGGVEKAGTL
jgi:hypothetical protein